MRKIFSAFVLFAVISTESQSQKNFIDQPFIEVTGSYDTLVTPDEIFIKITLNDKDSRNRNSVEEQEKSMIAGFKTMGLDTEKDLVVSDILSNYRYYIFKKDIQKTKSFVLKVKTAFMAGKVFIMLENLEISNANVISVNHSQLKLLQSQCRAKAAENAKFNALQTTNSLGQALGHALNVVDVEPASTEAVKIRGNMSFEYKYKEAESRGVDYVDPDVNFEKIKVQKTVNVKFALNSR